MAEHRNEHRPPRRPGHGGHGGPPGAPVEKPKDFKGTMGKLLKYIGGYKYAVLMACVFAAVSTVFSVQAPKVLGNATTELFAGVQAMYLGIGGIDFTGLKYVITPAEGDVAEAAIY